MLIPIRILLLLMTVSEAAGVFQYLYNVGLQQYMTYDSARSGSLYMTANPVGVREQWEVFEFTPGKKRINSNYFATQLPGQTWHVDGRHAVEVNAKMSQNPYPNYPDFVMTLTTGIRFTLKNQYTKGFLGIFTRSAFVTTCTVEVAGVCEHLEWELRDYPTGSPTAIPTAVPTAVPTAIPTAIPTAVPTAVPTAIPTAIPTAVPTAVPTAIPTAIPTAVPTTIPTTAIPTTLIPTTMIPTMTPTTMIPSTVVPTAIPTAVPTVLTSIPTAIPTSAASVLTGVPTLVPTVAPTMTSPVRTVIPTSIPSPTNIFKQPKQILEEQEQVDSIGTAGAITSVLGVGASSGAATRLVMIAGGCQFAGEDQEFPLVFHPTDWTIRNSKALGLVIGNLLIMFGFWGLCFVVFKLAQIIGSKFYPKTFEDMDTQGLVRFPSAPLFVFIFFYQGTSLGGLILIFYADDWVHLVSGLATTLACVIVPLLVCLQVSKDVPALATYVDDDTRNPIKVFFLGQGEWVSKQKHNHWVQRYKCVVRAYRVKYAWYCLFELYSMLSLACMRAITVVDHQQCAYVKLAQGLIFYLLLLLEAVTWPHSRYRDATVDFIVVGVQGTGLVLQAVGYFSGDMNHYTFLAASKMFLCSVFITLIKVIVDIISEVYILITGSRTRLQQEQWDKSPFHSNVSFVASPAELNTSCILSLTGDDYQSNGTIGAGILSSTDSRRCYM